MQFDDIRRRIAQAGPGLHSAGTFSERTFDAIARAAADRRITHSAETGSGASTLLFSHISQHHTVFALDDGSGSITNARRSFLLRPNVVTFVEGPTQLTLPHHVFPHKLQLALLDGPHAYPFPDLEYYYVYPHLESGALLIVDDIHIPTVQNLFQFLRRDAMFTLDRVVETTAFFTRTDAPAFPLHGDGWERQNFNARLLLRYTWRDAIKNLLPASARQTASRWKRRAALRASRSSVSINAPQNTSLVVDGTASMPPDSYLWILVRRKDVDGWWPQGGGARTVDNGHWSVSVTYGNASDAGREFEIAALIVGQATHDLWTDWVRQVRETGQFPPVQLTSAAYVMAEAFRTIVRPAVR